MQNIDRNAYLAYSEKFTENEMLLRDEFSEWLPECIIDCHAHCNLPEHVLSIDDRSYHHMLSTFPSFSLVESRHWHGLFYPGKRLRTLRFPKTFRGIDHRRANLYLLEESLEGDRVALYGLPDDVPYTIDTLSHPRVSALKMYYSYLNPPATEVYQYFPPPVLEVAERLSIPIILHPPRVITKCIDQLLRLLQDFPALRVSVAHMGLTKCLVPGLREAYEQLARFESVVLDTSMVPSAEVILLGLQVFGLERVMFGSDEPLSLIRAATYEHPEFGQRLMTEYPYHWVNPSEQSSYRHLVPAGITHCHWQCMAAIKAALTQLADGMQVTAKQNLFHNLLRG